MSIKKFNNLGNLYAKFRPTYPDDLLDYLDKEANLSKDSIIADIGSGTGILSKQFISRGYKVLGVEPNESMRCIAEDLLKNENNFISINATAEDTTIENESIDFITTAQAFHWFDRQLFRMECKRILKSNGKVSLIWNMFDNSYELIRRNDEINIKYCPNFKGSEGGAPGKSPALFDDFFIERCMCEVFENNFTFDQKEYIGLILSGSYALKSTDKNYDKFLKELINLFSIFSNNGLLTMPNKTYVYTGKC